MAASKLQRWMDLLAALLSRRYTVTFEDLRHDVPAYQHGAQEAVRRTFERDKDELRRFGVPIETVREDGEIAGYRMRSRDFYLPYLVLVDEERRQAPTTVDRDGFRGLARLAFTADELAAIADGARRALALGDGSLSTEIRSALRKLAGDLPIDGSGTEHTVPAPQHDDRVLQLLGTALERRKRVRFAYRSVATGADSQRDVEPLGLFFLSRHWYLAARDDEEAVIKNYRVSRLREVAMNTRRPNSPDFVRPAGWSLREHARQREAWELGDGLYLDGVVEFLDDSGAAASAMRLGAPVPGHERERLYEVRRLEPFVRWLLPLAGRARPVAPAELVEAWHEAVRQTLSIYEAAHE